MGRAPKADDEKKKHGVTIWLNDEKYELFKKFCNEKEWSESKAGGHLIEKQLVKESKK